MATRTERPAASDFTAFAQYRFGILMFELTLHEEAQPVWVRAISVVADREDGASDSFTFDIGEPIRMNPTGTVDAHWRPGTIDLEDPDQPRPQIRFIVTASRDRQHPVEVSPHLDVDDGFTRTTQGYELIPESPFGQEVARRSTNRLAGLVTREG